MDEYQKTQMSLARPIALIEMARRNGWTPTQTRDALKSVLDALDQSQAEAPAEQSDDCNCPLCQMRRSIEASLKAKGI